MLIDINFCLRAKTPRRTIHTEFNGKYAPQVCEMETSIGYFPYARQQNDWDAAFHYIIMSNHVVGISIFTSQTRKPMGTESLKTFA